MVRGIAGLLLVLWGGVALAQGLINPFDLEPSARAAGYAGAYCALARGADALIFNPAGLSWDQGLSVSSAYVSQLGGLSSVVWLAGAYGPVAGAFATMSVGGIEAEPGGSELAFSHMAGAVGAGLPSEALGLALPVRLGLGVCVRYDRAQLADQGGSGLALVLGVLGAMDLGPGELRFGVSVEDIGFGITFTGIERREPWTLAFRAGVALVSPAFVIALDYYQGMRLGLGMRFSPMFEVRGGMAMDGGGMQFALGLGVNWNSLSLDYALVTHPFLAPSHRFGLSASF